MRSIRKAILSVLAMIPVASISTVAYCQLNQMAEQAFGDPRSINFLRKAGPEGEVHGKEPHSRAIRRTAEVLAADFQAIAGCDRPIERAQVRRAAKLVLIDGKWEELLRVSQ